MFQFLFRRTLGGLVILLFISAVTYFLFFEIPQDPALLSCGKNCTPDMLAQIRHNLGIDHPIPVQYWDWLKGVFVGRDYGGFGNCNAPCLGYSFANREPVLGTILDRLPTTLSLAFGAAVVFL
ncbi:MAG: peptide/nickel transport system permease protein, partial [Streptomyces sp.]|nr:peptide/nickel transport system permease protein [Streptomyces sp.]